MLVLRKQKVGEYYDMARTVGIGKQDFGKVVANNNFYIDKTLFIKEWWENDDEVTLITRPRRFGKTLNMSMVEQFFSVDYAGRGDLFKEMNLWKEEKYQKIQGKYPVIAMSFADIKDTTFLSARKAICHKIQKIYHKYEVLLEGSYLNMAEKEMFQEVSPEMESYIAADSIRALSDYLERYYGRKPLILLDEYDTPMQEAYLHGYWSEMAEFIQNLFNATFKTNPFLERAILTGITRVSKESVFSDLNNLVVVTTTSDKYSDAFGFTQEEVSAALDEFGLSDMEQRVKEWYDGFTFGKRTDIYNPWSVINFLDEKRLSTFWANTSSNSLIGKLVQESGKDVKMVMENLLNGGTFHTEIEEQVVFSQLGNNESAIWSLLLATGYLKVEQHWLDEEMGTEEYELGLTNKEVIITFKNMIKGWFKNYSPSYNDFVKALLFNDIKAMNYYMNKVALATFSSFDVGNKPSESLEPERFYHGFVLGLIVELSDRYVITSNRESGFGRYDVMLEPRNPKDDAIILEFKVYDGEDEKTLEETVQNALNQIEDKRYGAALEARGVLKGRIRNYGFAFQGKKVLIGGR